MFHLVFFLALELYIDINNENTRRKIQEQERAQNQSGSNKMQ